MLNISKSGGRVNSYSLTTVFPIDKVTKTFLMKCLRSVSLLTSPWMHTDGCNECLTLPRQRRRQGNQTCRCGDWQDETHFASLDNRERASHLKQLHIHIDDASIAIAQKRSGQLRREVSRGKSIGDIEESENVSTSSLSDYSEELTLPWGHLLRDRAYNDELASLHLIFAAVAAEELANKFKQRLVVYLHGVSFDLPTEFDGIRAGSLSFRRFSDTDPESFKGRVFVESTASSQRERSGPEGCVALLRAMAVILDTMTGLKLSEQAIGHGESETRFVAVFNEYIKPQLDSRERRGSDQLECRTAGFSRERADSSLPYKHGYVILSDDTDVF